MQAPVFSFLFVLEYANDRKMATKKPRAHCNNVLQVHGADSRIRTGDLILTKDALYRLSYISMLSFDNVRILS